MAAPSKVQHKQRANCTPSGSCPLNESLQHPFVEGVPSVMINRSSLGPVQWALEESRQRGQKSQFLLGDDILDFA